MSSVRTLQDWIDTHIGGDCDKAGDCVILLAQVVQKELNPPNSIKAKLTDPIGSTDA